MPDFSVQVAVPWSEPRFLAIDAERQTDRIVPLDRMLPGAVQRARCGDDTTAALDGNLRGEVLLTVVGNLPPRLPRPV